MADKSSRKKLSSWLSVVLVIVLVLAVAALFLSVRDVQQRESARADTAEVGLLAASLPTRAMAALAGEEGGFPALQNNIDRATRVLRSAPAGIDKRAWETFLSSARDIADSREDLTRFQSAVQGVTDGADDLTVRLANLADASRGLGARLDDVADAARDAALAASALARGDAAQTQEAARSLSNHEIFLGELVMGVAGKDGAAGVGAVGASDRQGEVESLETAYRQFRDHVIAVVAGAEEAARLREEARSLVSQAPGLTPSGAGATGGLVVGGVDIASPWFALALLGVAVLLAGGMAATQFVGEDPQVLADRYAAQNDRNQEAILRLLDEMGDLADGDLTVQATVTEDITGTIADSINKAIETLRGLVATINGTAIRVDGAARQTQATASHLAKASETQSRQVAEATESIARMAASVEAVSGDSERSADVARHSVDIAHKGGEAVRRTIEGMNAIRETIQETSKRIKRLGESSQEIGNIVELINDIAEQTNILALNASIQASMAGEAGRGFAVVADEVQRLAERSANATRQIEVLVKTIQSDTNEAVVSMEQSTIDVVGGARLAENAGAALDEIESVSHQIASLVQNISVTSRGQATAAGDITRGMGVLREVSSQTAEATSATSASIGKLAELAKELRKTVAGFRLPDEAPQQAVRVARPRAVGQ